MDYVGVKFGRYTIIETYVEKFWVGGKTNKFNSRTIAKCVCDCGTKKEVRMNSLKNGNTKSCGCYERDMTIQRNYKHGYGNHPLKSTYFSMLYRCNDPKRKAYSHYGGRGIKVCDEWQDSIASFINWAENNGYKKGLQLDRIDNDGHYEPSNCHFIKVKDNLNNRRNTIKINGMLFNDFLTKASQETGIPADTLRSRYFLLKKRGITPTEENIVHYHEHK